MSLKFVAILLMSCFLTGSVVLAQEDMADPREMRLQINLYEEVTERLDEIFSSFSTGYLSAHEARDKVALLRYEYDRQAKPVPKEAKKLYELMRQLLSSVDYYFIHYKRSNREHPGINVKLARDRYELTSFQTRIPFP